VSLCGLCGEGFGLAFQFPDYQISRLPNYLITKLPNYPITKSKSLNYQISGAHPLRSQSSQFGVDFSNFHNKSRCFSPCLRASVVGLFGVLLSNFPITKLPNYQIQITQLPNLGGLPLRSQSSQFGVDFSNFHTKSRCFSPCLRASVVGVRSFNYTTTRLPIYQLTMPYVACRNN
jgi:hypothetical protein